MAFSGQYWPMPKVNGRIVRDAMARQRMKRADLAARTGIDPRTLTNAIGANRHNLDASKIWGICDALGLEYEDVVDEQGPEGQPSTHQEGGEASASAASVRGAA